MSEKKETITLRDFLTITTNAMGYLGEYLDMENYKIYKCPECNKTYDEDTKFCSKDGKEIIEEKRQKNHSEYHNFALDILHGLSSEELPEDYPYTFVDEVEIVAGRDEYWTNFIIQRKSDEKYFYITTYEGKFDCEYFEETKEIVTTVWEFEKYFN
jgi:predicted nucleic acid-binding Zn ribbon protein